MLAASTATGVAGSTRPLSHQVELEGRADDRRRRLGSGTAATAAERRSWRTANAPWVRRLIHARTRAAAYRASGASGGVSTRRPAALESSTRVRAWEANRSRMSRQRASNTVDGKALAAWHVAS